MKNDYEELSLGHKADWLRLAADMVNNSKTLEEAYDRLNKAATEAEEARDAYKQNKN